MHKGSRLNLLRYSTVHASEIFLVEIVGSTNRLNIAKSVDSSVSFVAFFTEKDFFLFQVLQKRRRLAGYPELSIVRISLRVVKPSDDLGQDLKDECFDLVDNRDPADLERLGNHGKDADKLPSAGSLRHPLQGTPVNGLHWLTEFTSMPSGSTELESSDCWAII
jgi:hypothetical protein